VFLRFCLVGNDPQSLDALDQPDDDPGADELLIVGRLVDRSVILVDGHRGGRRCGWQQEVCEYEVYAEQPPQDVLRNRDQWSAWASAEFEKTKGGNDVA
jgi:hypothetical protein